MEKCKLIVISGSSGAGKTTLANRIAEISNRCSVLYSDHYYESKDYPKSLKSWIENGADIEEWNNSKLVADVTKLKKGKSIIDPLTKKEIGPNEFIITDNAFGRCLSRFNPLIDVSVFIDIPLEIALARRINRSLLLLKNNGIDKEKYINDLSRLIELYLNDSFSDFYQIIANNAKLKCDLKIDGKMEISNSATMILDHLKTLKG